MIRDEWKADEWVQADGRVPQDDEQGECRSTKQHQTRCWNRAVFVPAGLQPIDIIKTYPFKIPLPPCYAGQPSVNRRNVKCIASAMLDPNLSWRNMYHFVIAPYEAQTMHSPPEAYRFDLENYVGAQVLITGHHRFLALLLCGIPPSELPPIQVRTAALAVNLFPWSAVEWGE